MPELVDQDECLLYFLDLKKKNQILLLRPPPKGGERVHMLEVSHKQSAKSQGVLQLLTLRLTLTWGTVLPQIPPNHKTCAKSGSWLPPPVTILKCLGYAFKGRNSTWSPPQQLTLLWSRGCCPVRNGPGAYLLLSHRLFVLGACL